MEHQPAPSAPAPILSGGKIEIEYLDGTKEVQSTIVPVGMQGTFLILTLPRDGLIAIQCSIIKRWEWHPSRIAVVRGSN